MATLLTRSLRSTTRRIVIAVIAATLAAAAAGPIALRSAEAAESPSAQPQGPITAAFFYPWFPNAWDQGVFPFTNYTPSLGWYDSADPQTIDAQLELASRAGLDAFVSSWWGPGHHTDRALPALLDTTVRPGSPDPDMRWTVYYEEEGQSDPSPAKIVEDLRYLESRYFGHPAYLRVDGKPVVFVWADSGDGASMADRWARAEADFGGDIHVVLKVFSGYRDVGSQPDSWHQYGPASAYQEHLPHSAVVSPGFWLKGQSPRLGRDLARFRADAQRVRDSGAFWQLVTSWNEWGEGTSVEPATEFGTAYIDALGEVFGGADPAPRPALVVTTPTSQPEDSSVTTSSVLQSSGTSITASPESSDSTAAAEADESAAAPAAPEQSVPVGSPVTITVDADAGGSVMSGSLRYRERRTRRSAIWVDAAPRIDGLVRFEPPANFRPTQATLRLHASKGNDHGVDVSAVADTTWAESNAMPRAMPAFGARLGSSGPIAGRGSFDVDVTAALRGDAPLSLGLRTTSTTRIRMGGPSSSRPPQLILVGQFVEPARDEAPVVEVTQPSDPATTPTGSDAAPGDGSATADPTTDSSESTTSPTETSATEPPTTPPAPTSPPQPPPAPTSPPQPAPAPAPPPSGGTVTFAAAGDFGGKDDRAGTVMNDIKSRNLAAFFLLGDMSYSEIEPESAWCDWVHSYLGSNYPVEIVAGNHEEDSRVDGYILDFRQCMPDRLGSDLGPGGYSVNYATDLGPVTVVSVSPDLVVGDVDYQYGANSPERTWMLGAIDAAKAEGDWVIVGMHKNCITIGEKSCEIGADFMQLLIDSEVDLVLQGHEHSYMRSHSLATVVRDGVGRIADDGSDGRYGKGQGTVVVVAGTAGRSMRGCSHSDREYGNFAVHWCGEEASDTKGYLLLTASPSSLSARFVTTAGTPFSDSFTIS
jgi:hypothetical protein